MAAVARNSSGDAVTSVMLYGEARRPYTNNAAFRRLRTRVDFDPV
jgi:hypothetical protein